MLIAFFVNDIEREYANYTTTVLAHQATSAGIASATSRRPISCSTPTTACPSTAASCPRGSTRTAPNSSTTLRGIGDKIERVDMTEIDVLMLRNDPSIDAQTTPWAMEAGILFGREAVRRGVIVLNDPDSLGRGDQQALFPGLPGRGARRDPDHQARLRHQGVRQGAWRQHHPQAAAGIGRIGRVQARPRERVQPQPDDRGDRPRRLHHRPGLCPGGEEGRHPLVPDERRPLEIDGKFAALRRVAAKDDIRSNIHAGGKAEAVEIGEAELRVAEIIRPKLIADGMFLVGIDIVGDKILEVNVFSPGNLHSCSRLAGVDFAVPILEAIERKVAIAAQYAHAFDNRHLAVL